jgi:transposase
MMQHSYLGVDVSRDWLEVQHPQQGAGRVANDPVAARALARQCRREGLWVVFEATGGYDRLLRAALEAERTPFTRANPGRVRDFARAIGKRAKTDRTDAWVLAEFGLRMTPEPTPPTPRARAELQALATRRRQLVEMRKQEATRLPQTADRAARADIRSLVAVLDRHIRSFEARMAALVGAEPEFAEASRRLRTAPGVGAIVAATLLAELPELGLLDRRKLAALAGLAPEARDSGTLRGHRTIGGGRRVVRTLLYIAALHASRCDDTFRALRQRLQEAGKPTKLALVATARKLLGVLNAMLASGQDYRPAHVA